MKIQRPQFPTAPISVAGGLLWLIAPIPALAQMQTAPTQIAPPPIRLEAEIARLSGPFVATSRAGFSGAGYVSGLIKSGDRLTWTLPDARAGIYQARLRYASPDGEKGTELVVNGAKVSALIPQTGAGFSDASLGKIELKNGPNTLVLEKGWGYYDVDVLELVPAKIDGALLPLPADLADPKASREARALMNLLRQNYGRQTLSGQYGARDSDYIAAVTGQTPAILGGDLMDYSPSRLPFGAKPEGTVEKLIEAARQGQILTVSWHWNAPDHLINASYTDPNGKKIDAVWYRGFYTNATTFDLQKALDNPQSNDYALILRDIDAIALQLKKFDAAGVPILWRPLHEAEGKWFWWGAKGPTPLKKLWRLMFECLSVNHDLHNLIWVYTAANNPDWYPGDDVVDIVGADAYPSDKSDPLSQTYDDLKRRFDGRKMIALSEFGQVPDIEKMGRFGVKWAYFTSWSGNSGPQPMDKTTLNRLYRAPRVLNRQEMKLKIAANASPTPFSAAAAAATSQIATALRPAAPRPVATPIPPANAASYRDLAGQTEANLRAEVLDQWFPRAVATGSGGGFDQNFSENWTNTSKGERSVVYQARLTWLASQAVGRFPAESAKWKAIASHGAEFLRARMWDAPNGGFFWALEAGNPARKGEKHAYGNAFAIYALAAHFHATGDARSLQMAQNAFRWLETNARDAKNGGYFEALSRTGRPILSPPSAAQSSDFIGTRYGYKSMNTHIHLLEAFAALHEVAPEPTLKARLREVFGLVRDTITVSPPGAMNLYFRPDWKAIPGYDSYGHDIESAFLLIEAARALGMPDDAKTWEVARSLVDHTLDFGLDGTNGGFYDAGGTFGGVSKADKVWWVQAEALNALLLMHEKYGAQTSRYWEAFVQQWSFIQAHQIDRKNGGWLGYLTPEGAPTAGAVKSDGWTEGYHQGRALLGVSATLRALSQGAGATREGG